MIILSIKIKPKLELHHDNKQQQNCKIIVFIHKSSKVQPDFRKFQPKHSLKLAMAYNTYNATNKKPRVL